MERDQTGGLRLLRTLEREVGGGERWKGWGVAGRRGRGRCSEAQGKKPGLFTFGHKQWPEIPSSAACPSGTGPRVHPGLFYRTIDACKVCSDLFLNRSLLGRDFESEPKAPT